MKHYLSKITAKDTAKALKEAEEQIERPVVANGTPVFVNVSPKDIRERLELFQPRRPGWGTHKLDPKHVKTLATNITRKGELDPVVVVKLGDQWVIVDGHHRVAAYLQLKRTDKIKCEWFTGTVREAMDESLRRNEKAHLRVDQGDKHEAAWTRTVLDWNGKDWSSSKRKVVRITGTSDGTVGKMRRWFKWHWKHRTGAEQTTMGEKMITALGADLSVHSWNKVNGVTLDLTPREWDVSDAAARLAASLTQRMTTVLSKDPEVTARALWLYDADLCPGLVAALEKHMRDQKTVEEDEAITEALGGP